MQKQKKVGIIFTVLLAMFCLLACGAVNEKQIMAVPSGYIEVYVKTGDTVWQIASEHLPKHMDIRTMTKKIEEASGTDGYIQPGQKLRVPMWKEPAF